MNELGGPSCNTRKRKRGGSVGASRMMYFFEELMKQVMEKQEAIQQRFLETIEKREQDRMIREEAWKRQQMARLNLEHERMAQHRAISASKHATIIAFLQTIAGQIIQSPSPRIIPTTPLLLPQSIPPPATPPLLLPQSSEVIITHHHQPTSSDHVIIAASEQQHSPAQEMVSDGFDSASSRWQEPEVLALIKLRSGLDSRYQEAGQRGLLWGEISAEMGRMGYNRSAKKCSEKWANINCYFKRVKEGKQKRPKDAEPYLYFHLLDALYMKNVHGGSNQTYQESPIDHNQSSNTETNINNNNNSGDDSNIEGATSVAKKPEDIVKELMEHRQSNHHQLPQPMTMGYYGKLMGEDNDNIEDDEEMDDFDDDEGTTEVIEDEDRNTSNINYNIEYQNRHDTGSYNGTANAATSTFLPMVRDIPWVCGN